MIRPKLPSVIFDEYLGDAHATLDSVRNLWFHTDDSGICDLTRAIRYERVPRSSSGSTCRATRDTSW